MVWVLQSWYRLMTIPEVEVSGVINQIAGPKKFQRVKAHTSRKVP